MKLPILYKRNSKGAIQYCETYTENKNTETQVVEVYGKYGTQNPHYRYFDNFSDPQEAENRARYNWEHQKLNGSKDFKDLGLEFNSEGYWQHQDTVYPNLGSALEAALPYK